MLWYDKWCMDKDESEEKRLIVDDGAIALSQWGWIYEDEIDVRDAAGNFLYSTAEEIKGKFEELIVSPTVVTIEDQALRGHAGLRKIVGLDNVTKIGRNAFKGCDNLAYVVAPKISPSTIVDPEDKQKLTMGYLLHKEQYPAEIAQEYEAYIKKQKSKLLALAQKHNLTEAIEALNIGEGKTSGKASSKTSTKQLTAEEKVLLLERAVLNGSVEEISAAIAAHKPFAVTARALGFACRCRDQAVVSLLLNEKATFTVKERTTITRFGFNYKPSSREFIANFALLPVVNNVWNPYLFGSMSKHYNRQEAKSVYSQYLMTEKDISAAPKEMTMAPAETRVANLQLLIEKKVLKQKDLNFLLYYAILEEQNEIASALIKAGGIVDVPWLQANGDHSSCTSELNQFLDAISEKEKSIKLNVLRSFGEQLEKTGSKLYLTENLLLYLGGSEDIDVATLLLQYGNVAGVNKKKWMHWLLDRQSDPAMLAFFLRHSFVKTPALREELIALATERNDLERLAVLMEYKNSTTDPREEAEKTEKKIQRELMADPNSVAELKKVWIYKKKADGTLIITSYKGTNTEVIVPDKIGQNLVTELGDEAFSPYAQRITNREIRNAITKITLPNSLTAIGSAVFKACVYLEEMIIPDSVVKMGAQTFRQCENLAKVKLSANQKGVLGAYCFFRCKKLKTVVVPKGITELGMDSFANCSSLKEVHLGNKVTNFNYCCLNKKKLTIYAPKGSAAEAYATKYASLTFVEE